MKNWRKPTFNSEQKSWTWTSLIVVLFSLFFLTRPIGQSMLEAVGLKDTRWEQMVVNIGDLVDSYDGEVGIYIKNLRTGQVFEKNSGKRFISASLIKLPIMAATFQAVKEGRLALDDRLKLRRRHRKGGSGNLKWTYIGNRYYVSDLIYRMITDSDNTATAVIIDKLGYRYLNDFFANNLRLETTRIDPIGMRLSDYIHPARDNYTTPAEMGVILEKIYNRDLITDGLSDLMIEVMKDANSPSRLARYLPSQWSLARKTGLLRKNCHDVGILYTEKTDYIICVLTRKNENYKKAKGLIASVGKAAYSYLGHS